MTDIEEALQEVAAALEACSLPYMLIGGLAVSAWGVARSTLDVDITVWAEPGELNKAIACLSARVHSDIADALSFVEQRRVLPLQSRRGIRIDVIFGVLALQRESIG